MLFIDNNDVHFTLIASNLKAIFYAKRIIKNNNFCVVTKCINYVEFPFVCNFVLSVIKVLNFIVVLGKLLYKRQDNTQVPTIYSKF